MPRRRHLFGYNPQTMQIDMSQHFTTRQLLRYTAPTMGVMVFTSVYSIVDGLFISNFVGTTGFAAVNFIMPFLFILGSVGFMMGTGGSAVVAGATHGGDEERARRYFSLLVYFTLVFGVIAAVAGFFAARPVAALMGATGEMLDICETYARITMVSLPFFTLQYAFEAFFNTAGKPKVGLVVTVIAGCTNIVLDALFVGLFGWGVPGAAVATAIAETVGGGVPIIYFARPNSTPFRLGRTRMEWRVIGKTCVNGSSEMVANIAMSFVGMLYNYQLLRFMGENGVAAYGVLMYVGMIFSAIFIGYTVGCAPLMSFQNGAGNAVEKRSLLKKSLAIIGVAGVLMLAAGELAAGVVTGIFTSYDPELHALATHAFRIYALAFFFIGYAIYGSSLFTSLEDGLISAVISFVRTLVFEAGAVMLLPVFFGAESIWWSFMVAEIAAVTLSAVFLAIFAKKYEFRPTKTV